MAAVPVACTQDRAPAPPTLAESRVRAAWLFLAPLVVLMVLVAGWPLCRTLWFSLTDADLKDLGAARFVGLDNYTGEFGVLRDPDWWRAVGNTLLFAGVSVAIETLLGLVVALVLDADFPGRSVVRAAVLVPWAIPTVVSAKMWAWMLNDQFGVINHVLMTTHLISQPLAWVADPSLALGSVIAVDVWKATPFMALLILAALQMLPTDCYEAARVDGIHPVTVFVRVTLPLIRPALMVAVIFRALDALRVFDLVYVLTSNSRDTMSMSIYARQQLVDFQQVGLGSAAATVLFGTVALCTALAITLGRVRLEGAAG
ncbi:carbohydrate ABC transporter permease [Lichenibacterium ramalinae]|uniref:Sugar ABC transporter permease n=1 Tax=Lichenibacterium ramalinae TaxID=2316527 RepID=A0A4Q2R780_9HYPH|nr:sugar ABC transporter permease [Lichenibacterium ramalinae]RYB02461.1 sugar ABC transporter permease [Lichenibacterium ramalinae]